VKKLSPAAVRALVDHPWPGNVRELEHVIEGAILLSTGDTIEPTDLSLPIPRGAVPSTSSAPAPAPGATLEELERDHIERVLRENGFNRTRSALALGISKKTLYLKIKRFGLDGQE
jgi:transcriptional regulator with PAS, ATPase and Fis domain